MGLQSCIFPVLKILARSRDVGLTDMTQADGIVIVFLKLGPCFLYT